MSAAAANASPGLPVTGSSPFTLRSVLLLVLFGALVFVALLWMIASGLGAGSANNGGAHAASRGLTGYSAMSDYLQRRGFAVRLVRSERGLDAPGLLVLTPSAMTDGAKIDRIVSARRYVGPTLVITPKWLAFPAGSSDKQARPGWVRVVGAMPPRWEKFHDEIGVTIAPARKPGGWSGMGISGVLPKPEAVLSGSGKDLVPLVTTADKRILAAVVDDGAAFPLARGFGPRVTAQVENDAGLYPLVFVFEPDLLDNFGMARSPSALLAERLVRASGVDPGGPVLFDLTLDGLGRENNLLTLAFTPPFLAATLCLLIAALVIGWRAFLRFGPPAQADRAIAYGKRALVANSAGLVRRSRRFHLLAGPYVERARERLARRLSLPRGLDHARTDEAIDRALASRLPDAEPFSAVAARLARARAPHEIIKAARELSALERMLQK